MDGLKSFLSRLNVLSRLALTTAVGLLGAGLLARFSGAADWIATAVWSGVGLSLLVWVLSGIWAWALDVESDGPGTESDAAAPEDTAEHPSRTPATPSHSAADPGRPGSSHARPAPSVYRRKARYLALPAAVVAITSGTAAQPVSRPCDPPVEFNVATTPESRPALEAAGTAYAQHRAEEAGVLGRHCRKVRVTVYAVADGQKMRESLTGVWNHRMGPLPHVWIPGSTSVAMLVEDALGPGGAAPTGIGTPALGGEGETARPTAAPVSAASSSPAPAAGTVPTGPALEVTDLEIGEWTHLTPLVLALPESMAERVTGGDADDSVVDNPYTRLREEFGRGGARVVRADPRDSAAALLHTAFLYHARGAITRNGDVAAEQRATDVEAELAPETAAGGGDLVCQVARGAGDQVPAAALTTEAAIYESSVRSRWRTACPGAEGAHEKIAALYSPRLPVLDHPFVTITGVRATEADGSTRSVTPSPEVTEEVDRFGKYLRSLRDDRGKEAFSNTFTNDQAQAASTGVYEGYRDGRGGGLVTAHVEGAPPAAPNTQGDPGAWSDKAAAVLDLYSEGRVGTVLLALDTSTSMAISDRKFTTAADEAAELVGAAGTKEALGLWAFPKGTGPSAAGAATAVELARGGGRGADRFTDALKGLAPVKVSTPLRDVIADGAEELQRWSLAAEAASGAGSRAGAQGRPAPMLVVLTDGVGAPAQGGLTQAQMERRLAETDVRVRVLAVGDETRRWGRDDPCDVGAIPELTAHQQVECVPADPDRPGEAGVGLLNEARRF